ncbi:hypothetical protein E1264_42320 [Actinomadura sp. KC216]|uniref:hypothetical protein n=1 Tax=Actinomadura sp. KC216 TaxID=2530370 RepID=UPI001046D566|nr:hypothetical protein [Actinomadura sp. KC216]TDB71687.1 hypothetical protein E1264_42320 [Actinomadura sp. KC216]
MTLPTPEPVDFPPAEHWPTGAPPDCPTCERPTEVVFIGPATLADFTEVNVWRCRACPADWYIPVTRWPVTNGPNCPYCHDQGTCWAAHAPDVPGDLWSCEDGHEFVLTHEGIVITPGNEDLSEWAPVWPRSRRDRRDGDA